MVDEWKDKARECGSAPQGMAPDSSSYFQAVILAQRASGCATDTWGGRSSLGNSNVSFQQVGQLTANLLAAAALKKG